MKRKEKLIMVVALIAFLLSMIRYLVNCIQYSVLYNFIHHMEYWIPPAIFFVVFLYFYAKYETEKRNKKGRK